MVATFEFVYPDGVERSFEEARAAALGLLGANFDTPRTKTKPDAELESPSPVKRRRRSYERPSSPTIHTKAALNDVMEMFNQPLAYENSDPDHSFDGNNEVEEKSVAIRVTKRKKKTATTKNRIKRLNCRQIHQSSPFIVMKMTRLHQYSHLSIIFHSIMTT
ncbi:hypothetical protein BDF19DRAFT_184844 [Syncephalis fuscata]|nr:hypothetical protein BDF19DRAFT_184844 [Syncephalis fuscata]